MKDKVDVLVVGGGISGIACAYFATKKFSNVLLINDSPKLGGYIQSFKTDDFLLECGPNTLMLKNQLLFDLLHELDLWNQIIFPDPSAKKRYIMFNGHLHPLPFSPFAMFSSNLLGFKDLLQIIKEPFAEKKFIRSDDISVKDFFTELFGKTIYENFVFPMVSGIYAGDPDKISFKHTFPELYVMYKNHGSIIKGFLKKKRQKQSFKKQIFSFPEGLKLLPQRMVEKGNFKTILNAKTTGLQTNESGEYIVKYIADEKEQSIVASKVIFTIPAFELSKIIAEIDAELSAKLQEFEYAPIQILHLAIQKKDIGFQEKGFGFLKSYNENSSILGCIFTSRIFPHTAPSNYDLLTVMSGGATQKELFNLDENEAIRLLVNDLDKILKFKQPPKILNFSRIEKAIPQYLLNFHDELLKSVRSFEKKYPGVLLAGNYLYGVSVPDCIETGMKTIQKI